MNASNVNTILLSFTDDIGNILSGGLVETLVIVASLTALGLLIGHYVSNWILGKPFDMKTGLKD